MHTHHTGIRNRHGAPAFNRAIVIASNDVLKCQIVVVADLAQCSAVLSADSDRTLRQQGAPKHAQVANLTGGHVIQQLQHIPEHKAVEEDERQEPHNHVHQPRVALLAEPDKPVAVPHFLLLLQGLCMRQSLQAVTHTQESCNGLKHPDHISLPPTQIH